MGFSSTVVFLLLCYSLRATAFVVAKERIVESKDSKTFSVHILERGTKFEEGIEIDEDKELEYFHVPAHNGLTDADFLYDFKNRLTVMRIKRDAKCYLSPLPDSLPSPSLLKTGLQMVPQTPPKNNVVVRKYWTIGQQMVKRFMRKEVREFCGHFPMFRLQEMDLDLAADLKKTHLGRTRLARDLSRANLTGLPFCKNKPFPTRKPDGSPACHPHDMLFDFEVRENHCTWWLVCRFSVEKKSVMCEDWAHKYNSLICYTPRCP